MWEVLGFIAAAVAIGGLFGLLDRLIMTTQKGGRLRGGDSSTPGGFYTDLG
jgi:hypothetical protein